MCSPAPPVRLPNVPQIMVYIVLDQEVYILQQGSRLALNVLHSLMTCEMFGYNMIVEWRLCVPRFPVLVKV